MRSRIPYHYSRVDSEVSAQSVDLDVIYDVEDLARFKKIIFTGSHKDDYALRNEILRRLIKSLMNSGSELSIDFAPHFRALMDETDFILSHLQRLNHEKFIFYQESLLRLLVADSLEAMILLRDHFVQLLDAEHLFGQSEVEKQQLRHLQALVEFICLVRWVHLKSQQSLDKEAYTKFLLEGISIFFTVTTVAIAPTIAKMAHMRPTSFHPIPIAVGVAENVYATGKTFYELREQAYLRIQRVSTYVKNYVKQNKAKTFFSVLGFIGLSVASVLIPPVGVAAMILMTIYSGVRIIEAVKDRIVVNRQTKILLNQQIHANNAFKQSVAKEPVQSVNVRLGKTPLTIKEEVASYQMNSPQIQSEDWVLSDDTRLAYRDLHFFASQQTRPMVPDAEKISTGTFRSRR